MQLWQSAAHARLTVQVRGTAQLDGAFVAASTDGTLTVRGRILDELGQAIARAPLHFESTVANGATQSATILRDCGDPSNGTPGPRGHVDTDDSGRFCTLLLRDQSSRGPLRVVFDGTDTYGKMVSTLALDDPRTSLAVDFKSVPRVADLDSGEYTFAAGIQPVLPGGPDDASTLALGVSLSSSERGRVEERELQRLQARLGADLQVVVPTSKLGPPGLAELVLTFDGNAAYKPFRVSQRVLRATKVKLDVDGWPAESRLGDRFGITVRATSLINVPPTGSIEITNLDGVSTLHPLRADGSVQVALRTPPSSVRNFLVVGYQSNDPGWVAQEPLRLPVELLPASRWSVAGWALATLLIVGWFAWSRRRAEPSAALAVAPHQTPPYAHLEIIESSADANAGWSAVVVDAHEGTPVCGAKIEVLRTGFDGQKTILSVFSDQSGRVEVPPLPDVGPGSGRLEITARGYSRLGLFLPPSGRVKVHLVSVRRTILDRLVSWVRRRGQPFDTKTEPTPNWVAEVARSKGHPEIESWASSVSKAAFGEPDPPDPDSPELLPPPGAIGTTAELKRNN